MPQRNLTRSSEFQTWELLLNNYAGGVHIIIGLHTSVTSYMDRDNETWMSQLGNTGPEQQIALDDLRSALLRNLRGAISTRTNVDESFLEDSVQDSLILILEKLDQFEGRSQFLTWATSIAIRISMSKLRRNHWKDLSLEQVLADTNYKLEESFKDNSEPETHFQRNAILNKMHIVINNELTEKQRTALLSELKGIPQEEIARFLGSNRNAVYKLTHDARKQLKRSLEIAGYCAADINAAFTA